MPIYAGATPVTGVYIGATPVTAVYQGTVKIWPPDTTNPPDPVPTYKFYDDFNRTTIGPDWTGSGGLIDAGALKKNNTNGSADYWTARTFDTDDLDVTAVLGPVTDPAQLAWIMLGSPSAYVYVEFSRNVGVIGDYNGTSWVARSNFGAIPWTTGDTIRVTRSGSTVTVYRNGAVVATGVSSVARGTAYRRVGLSVRRASNFFGTYYGPTFDSVGVN